MTEMRRVLVAVADSPASLAAARTAIALAGRVGAELRAVHVVQDGTLEQVIEAASHRSRLAERRETAAAAVLHHVAALAERAGVAVSTVQELGDDVARCVLHQARDWPADLIVLGRTARHGAGEPFLAPVSQHVLEFSECPVLVVPG
jgi:nucleotide-binding universal stress UspA family protein